MGIVHREEFKMLRKEWEKTLPFQYFNFPYNKSLEKEPCKLNISEKFSNLTEV
jgi:hypothetical protein